MAVIQRKIAPTLLPDARLTSAETPASEGAGVSQAKARALDTVSGVFAGGAQLADQMIRQEQDSANETALLKASNALSSWKNTALYDPANGAMTKMGQDALPLPQSVADDFNKNADAIAGSLGNQAQRDAFAKLRAQEYQQVNLEVNRHVFEQMQEFKAGELKSAIDNGTNDAIRAANDPALVGASLDKTEQQMRTNLPRLGVGPQQVEQQVRDMRSNVHVGVINQLLAQAQDKKASAYFDEVKGEINGDALDNVTKAIEGGTVRGDSQRLADGIIAAGGTFEEQMAKVKAIDDPTRRDEAQQRVEHQHELDERAAAAREQDAAKQGYDIIDKTGTTDKIPPAMWFNYSGATRSAMQEYAKRKTEGVPLKTDQPTFYKLMTQAGNAPEDFTKVDLLQFKAKLSDGDFQQLAGIQLSIKNGERNGETIRALDGFRTRQEILNTTLRSYGIEPNDPLNDSAIAEVQRMLDRRVDDLQAPDAKGTRRQLTDSDIQKVLDGLLSQQGTATQPGSIWNLFKPGKSVFATQGKKPLVRFSIDDVPETAKASISKKLADRHLPVSDQTILDVYIESQVK
jgi:hypothetical protein